MPEFFTNFLDPKQWEFVFQIILAAMLGGFIGLEREYRQKPAGFRTHLLVSVGSTLFTILSIEGFKQFGSAVLDPSRVASNILTGIGFIGAGAILRHEDRVVGLTTAAGLWLTAAIGMAVGTRFYTIAIVTSAVIIGTYFVSRVLLDFLRKVFNKLR
jgi:putative Mg2+ transporter-C (MgtC) family protein